MSKGFAELLAELLMEKGITPYRAAQVSGVSKQMLSLLLNGKSQPSWETVVRLSRALGVSTEAFVVEPVQLPGATEPSPRGRPKKPAETKGGKGGTTAKGKGKRPRP
jgi:transcriptional regulator with XRE-family HTH domain